jgi:predicted N-acyltransferase
MGIETRFLDSIREIPGDQWDSLFPGRNPFVSHAFLKALEDSGSANAESGWQPRHLVLESEGQVVGAMPLYLKDHSYGEFVFDWGWAEAYRRNGLEYYPKLLTAIPFTPSTGPRLGLAADQDAQPLVDAALNAVTGLATANGYSGWHLLFPEPALRESLAGQPDLLVREDIQFHWRNREFGTFDDFLGSLKSSRRKTLGKERRLVSAQGVEVERKQGPAISEQDWEGFYDCYMNTYFKRSGHGGYLNRMFFDLLLEVLREQLLLVVARRDGDTVGNALFLFDDRTLYGRYWGALQDVSCLHFEACFYQGIEFCIEQGLQRFDPGTQGEHKLLRGFEPVKTCSVHWLADPRFRHAIADYLDRERDATDRYGERAIEFLPFRKN